MGHICDGLNCALEGIGSYTVQAQCQNNTDRHARDDTVQRDTERINDQGGKLVVIHEFYKPFKADPIAVPDALGYFVILERDDRSVHWPISKRDDIN